MVANLKPSFNGLLFFLGFFFINRYNDRNIGLKVFYNCMVLFDVHLNLDYDIFIYKIKVTLLAVIYTHYSHQHTCYVVAPDAPSEEVGHWSAITLHTTRVFIAPTPGVPFKIPMPSP